MRCIPERVWIIGLLRILLGSDADCQAFRELLKQIAKLFHYKVVALCLIFKMWRGNYMEETLTIRLPNEIRKVLNRTPDEMGRDLRVYGALMLFRLGKLSSGAASLMAGVPRVMFLDLCAEYDIPVSQITPDELRREINNG